MFCLIFRLEHDKGKSDPYQLANHLQKLGFQKLENDGLKAVFADGDYETFDEACKKYAAENKVGIETFQMEDPGLGIMYEMSFAGRRFEYNYPSLEKYEIPKCVKKYRKYLSTGDSVCLKERS